jgi:hypothetical protein
MNKISEENMHKEEFPVRNASDEYFEELQLEDLNFSITILGALQ